MKKFMLFSSQDEQAICELEYGKFSTGILELGDGFFVVNVVTHKDRHNYQVGIYRDIQEAAQAVQTLKDFAFAVVGENKGFEMPIADEPVSALEILDLLL